jgi:O-antigen ligase
MIILKSLSKINKTYLLNRTDSVFFEINLWMQNTSNFHEGAIYSRLGMWEVGFLLANESLFFGFGEKYLGISVAKFYDFLPLNLHHPLNILIGTGPHSDFLAKLLASGIIGAFAYVITIFIPLLFFFKFICENDFIEINAVKNTRNDKIHSILISSK